MAWDFVDGKIYNRRRDIHGRFNGQRQGGIITPSDRRYPIIIITGEAGGAHGYADHLREDGVFEYSGEGQIGDMTMTNGNLAIRDHATNGRDLLLFRKQKDGLRFLGQFVLERYLVRRAPDRERNDRDAFVFELQPMEAVQKVGEGDVALPNSSLRELRSRAVDAARVVPATKTAIATVFERSRLICTYVYARAEGLCEHCEAPAPFTRLNGTPYLEAHHIRRLTDGGPDDPRHMIAVCPNCHRRAHFGDDRDVVNQRMQEAVNQKEAGKR